jgi:hypothetical protein
MRPLAERFAPHRRGGETLMHRLILQSPKEMVVDHSDGNGLDNGRCPL